MSKFNVGDIVVGNSENDYGVTCCGWQGEVIALLGGDNITVKNLPGHGKGTFDVMDRFFDLVSCDNCISIW